MRDADDAGASEDARPPVLGTVLWWLAYLGLYLALISGVTWREVVAGAAVSALAVAASLVALRGAGISFAGGGPALWRVGAVLRIVAAELQAYGAALGRLLRREQPDSRYLAVPLSEGLEAGADAAVTLEAAIAPNTLLVAVLEGQDALLLHQLTASSRAKTSFPRWSDS